MAEEMNNIEKSVCVELSYNSNMGANECSSERDTIFFHDRNGWVKVDDTVECERTEKGFYGRIWVNGVLKTQDHFKMIHGE